MNDIYVAKLGKAVGLKGHVKLFIESDFPEQFTQGATFITNKNQTLIVEEYNSKRGVVKFETIDDMDNAKKLTNSLLFTSYEQTKASCTLKEKQYFWFDMIGCDIVEEGETLGRIEDIQRYPLSDYLEVKTAKALIEAELPKVFLIPYLDEYILNVDLDKKVVTTSGAKLILENS